MGQCGEQAAKFTCCIVEKGTQRDSPSWSGGRQPATIINRGAQSNRAGKKHNSIAITHRNQSSAQRYNGRDVCAHHAKLCSFPRILMMTEKAETSTKRAHLFYCSPVFIQLADL